MRTVFAPKIDTGAEPPGWAAAPPVHLGPNKVKDTYVNGAKKIVFYFIVG